MESVSFTTTQQFNSDEKDGKKEEKKEEKGSKKGGDKGKKGKKDQPVEITVSYSLLFAYFESC